MNQSKRALAPFSTALCAWFVVSVLCLVSAAWIYFSGGMQRLDAFLQTGPASNLHVTVFSVAIIWLLAGGVLALVDRGQIHSSNLVILAGFFLIALLYVNVLRERTVYGDVQDYIQAANNLYSGQPLQARYLYPPLWATLLEPLVPLGDSAIFDFCWLLNIGSLFAFYFLLQRILQRYGFSANLSALVTCAFMIVNVPILRTLGNVQTNLHVTNLILLSLLIYPRSRFISAFAIAVAVHLKVSPIVMILPFLLNRDLRWFAGFVFGFILLALATVSINGWSPYQDWLANTLNIYAANGIAFRDNSIDSFFRAAAELFNFAVAQVPYLVIIAKSLLTAAVLLVAWVSIKRQSFFAGNRSETILYNSAPVLLILMTMASPLVWTHHPVFLALSYLVMLKRLSSASDWLIFALAYFLEFLVPTFDFFPWSYGRLLSPLLLLGLAWTLSKKSSDSAFFTLANRWLNTVLDYRMIAAQK